MNLEWVFRFLLSSVLAAPSPTPPKMIYKTSEQLQFSGAQLRGRIKKPELSYIYERKGLRAEQIVNIPENFNSEIINGAGKL